MSGAQYDAPNQQVVRADGSAPWEEGTGGAEETPGEPSQGPTEAATAAQGPSSDLEDMTKAELLDMARSMGLSPANEAMTKAELAEGIEAARTQRAP